MQTVLITGANGFVGRYLVERLLLLGYCVIATGRGDDRLHVEHKDLQYQSLDITDRNAISWALEKYRPGVVVHTAALSSPDDCESNRILAAATNTTATRHLLEAASKQKSFFIFLSTDFVFSGLTGMYSEEDLRQPVNYYGETKLWAEDLVREYADRWCIIRTVLVYGKRREGRHNLLTVVAEKLAKGEQYNVFNDQIRTPTYVEDLTMAIGSIIEKKLRGIFHISGNDVLTPFEMAQMTARHLGLPESLLHPVTSDTFEQPARRPSKTGFTITKAEKEFNFQPTSFAEGLLKTFRE
ncbi:MAG: SDR family oxidoreductase [Chitinophagaceae bacterium]